MEGLSVSEVLHRNMSFNADGESLAGTFISADSKDKKDRILFLHGAGNAVRQRIFYLADHLAARGHYSFCFDFSGHGESSGAMRESSLERRRRQAVAARKIAGQPAPKIIVGTSMGGYVAASLASEPDVHILILICPALYAREAHTLTFDEKFTAILRQPDSFRTSQISDDLKAFKGRVLLLIGSEDKVIPQAVMDIYNNAFPNAMNCQYAVIPAAPHTIHLWAAQNSANQQQIFTAIDHFLS